MIWRGKCEVVGGWCRECEVEGGGGEVEGLGG